ncbi:MAG: hypothetical protein AABZ08_07665 [Planctomycetota bacterium]
MKWFRLTASGCLVVVAAVWSLVMFGSREVARLTERTQQLEVEKRELHDHIRRLGSSHRVAQIDIIGQHSTEAGQTFTRLRWQEMAADGSLKAPIQAEIIGKQLYVEAMIVKFDPELVKKEEPGRGESIAVFRRVFGDQQNPQWGYDLTMNQTVEERDNGPNRALWNRFWEVVDNPTLAKTLGVRVAQCEAPAVPVKMGQTWEVSLDAIGGLNLKKIREGGESVKEPG